MKIGSLGDIAFEVSPNSIKTISNLSRSGSVRFEEHKRHLRKSKLEFTGIAAEKVSFDIKLSAYLGVNPTKEIEKIREHMNKGEPLVFVLGKEIIGEYRWVVTSYSVRYETHDNDGQVLSASVSIELLEYVR